MKLKRKAQTATELAIFGSILLFIAGVILRQSFGSSYLQNHNLRAMRMAMSQSFESTQGPGDGTASRNSATVIVVEDRLTASSTKYGAVDRTPQLASGQATHSRNLFLPVECPSTTSSACEYENLPVMDIFVNGQHFPFTVAAFKDVVIPNGESVFRKIPNHESFNYNEACDECFDLDRSGLPLDFYEAAIDRDTFSWQWEEVDPSTLEVDDTVDVDGDLKEERVKSVSSSGGGTSLVVQDFQDGDIDLSYNTFNEQQGALQPGLQTDVQMLTFSQRPDDPRSEGTFLRIEEGKLYGDDNQIVRSVTRKDQVDLILRIIRLSNAEDEAVLFNNKWCQPGRINGVDNPVEVCGRCYEEENFSRTCFDIVNGVPYIFVRSRLSDRRGRKWITNIMADDYVDFSPAVR